MTLVLPLEEIEEGPVKDSMEIIRQWTEDLERGVVSTSGASTSQAAGSVDQFGAVGTLVFYTEGSIVSNGAVTINTPNGKEVRGIIGVSDSFATVTFQGFTGMGTDNTQSDRVIMSHTGDKAAVLLRNRGPNTRNYKLHILYEA